MSVVFKGSLQYQYQYQYHILIPTTITWFSSIQSEDQLPLVLDDSCLPDVDTRQEIIP